MTGERWLIAGLGNPGPAYSGHRHNAGFMVADELASRMGARLRHSRYRAAAAEGRLAGHPVVLCKPLTFMNDSGGPVAGLAGYYRIAPAAVMVIHDELDLPFGIIRLKYGGGGSHNGLRSVISSLGTTDFYRVRVGIGRPPGRMNPAAYVLRDFSAQEREELPLLIGRAADAVETLLTHGLATAQNTFHPAGGESAGEEPAGAADTKPAGAESAGTAGAKAARAAPDKAQPPG